MLTEVVSEELVEPISEVSDILQVGSRNAQNFQLLKRIGIQPKPVVIKRGFMNTLEEFLLAAEYIALMGNHQILLCERGIRTFEPWTRNTLDISAIPLMQQQSYLPVIVDPSHAAGRTDLVLPLVKAALAVGAQGAMIEVHPNPSAALSDGKQTLDFNQFTELVREIEHTAKRLGIHLQHLEKNDLGLLMQL